MSDVANRNGIDANPRTIRQLLSGVRYSIEFYQREYLWERRNIEELLEDLQQSFFSSYRESDAREQVEKYGHYFLGSMVINSEGGRRYVIDGQQRLTSLTLLLIYLNNLQKDAPARVKLDDLIFSERFGKKAYNFDVPERAICMDALYKGKSFDATHADPSVRNMAARYADIEELFPDTLKGEVLPYFIDWLLENVDFVEIVAFSDDAAYTIFETMNDRGISLSPTDMLKGYLLSNINDDVEQTTANQTWKDQMEALGEFGKEEGADFFKAWLRAKFADSIRDRKKGATNKDFDKIGTAFHRWLKDNTPRVGLARSDDFYDFVQKKYVQFSEHYMRVRRAAVALTPGLEPVYYNAYNGFTLQYPLVLAPIVEGDDLETVNRKIRLVAGYLDIYVALRMWNFRTLGYSSIVWSLFTNVLKDIRDKSVPELVDILTDKVAGMGLAFGDKEPFRLHKQNGYHVRYLLSRITSYVEEESGMPPIFATYVSREIKNPFEIEHILADKYSRYAGEYATEGEFADYRSRIGNLLLLPHRINQSIGDNPYEDKVKVYLKENLLARSLNEEGYHNNPAFLTFVRQSGLPFRPYEHFTKQALVERQELYRQFAERIWSASLFERELH